MKVVASIVDLASTVPAPPDGFFQVRTALVEVVESIVATKVVGGSGAVPIATGSDAGEVELLPSALIANTRKM